MQDSNDDGGSLTGQVAVATGAAQGVGRAISQALGKAGATGHRAWAGGNCAVQHIREKERGRGVRYVFSGGHLPRTVNRAPSKGFDDLTTGV